MQQRSNKTMSYTTHFQSFTSAFQEQRLMSAEGQGREWLSLQEQMRRRFADLGDGTTRLWKTLILQVFHASYENAHRVQSQRRLVFPEKSGGCTTDDAISSNIPRFEYWLGRMEQ